MTSSAACARGASSAGWEPSRSASSSHLLAIGDVEAARAALRRQRPLLGERAHGERLPAPPALASTGGGRRACEHMLRKQAQARATYRSFCGSTTHAALARLRWQQSAPAPRCGVAARICVHQHAIYIQCRRRALSILSLGVPGTLLGMRYAHVWRIDLRPCLQSSAGASERVVIQIKSRPGLSEAG